MEQNSFECKMIHKFYLRFLRWLLGWASLLQGLCCILTLGFWYPSWELDMAIVYSKAKVKINC